MSFRSINWQNVTRVCGLGALSLATAGCLSNGTVVEGGDDEFNVGTVQQRIETYRSATVYIAGSQYDMVAEDDFGGNAGGGQPRGTLKDTIWKPVNLGVNYELQAYTQRQCSSPQWGNNPANPGLEKWNICQADGTLTLLTRKENLSCIVWQQCADTSGCIEGGTCTNGWCTYDKNNNSVIDAAECAPFVGGANAPVNNTQYSSGRVETDDLLETGLGYTEFRAKMPFADAGLGSNPPDGMWPAIWSLNAHSLLANGGQDDSTGWPNDGELDVMEYTQIDEGQPNERGMGFNALWRERDYNQNLTDANWWLPQACSSWPSGGHDRCDGVKSGSGLATWNGVNIDYTHWHTWGLVRDQNGLKIYIRDDDGVNTNPGMTDCLPYESGCQPVASMDLAGVGADEYKEPYYWIMNNAMGGELGCKGWKDRPGEGAGTCINVPFDGNGYNAGAKLVVDYFRHYKKNGDTYAAATSACGTGSNSNNLILNCGFDRNHLGHRTDAFYGGATGQLDVVDDGVGHGAVQSTRIGGKGTDAWNVQIRQEGFTLQQDHSYTWSVDLKSVSFGNQTVTMKIVESPNADGDTTQYELANDTVAVGTDSSYNCAITQGSWVTCTGPQFTVKNGTGKYKFEIDVGGIAVGEVYSDNMMLKDTAGPTVVCGDGKKEGTEQCDDGNTVTESFNCPYSSSGPPNCPNICNSTCQSIPQPIKYCGDAVVQTGEGEQCDDANSNDTDACRNSCLTSTCQDGIKNQGETAIDCGGPCSACGGGAVCNALQTINITGATSTAATLSPANLVFDGSINTRWETILEGTCSTLCDNGPELELDFGQNRYIASVDIDWEAANASAYSLERYNGGTWYAVGSKSGLPATQHRVDNFANVNQVGSKLRIKVTAKNLVYGLSIWEINVKGDENASCSSGAGVICGNGIKEGSEVCDDGNTATEACAYGLASCQVCGSACTLVAGATSRCGDGTRDSANGEQCDDGNAVNTDACKNDCKTNVGVCGDSVINSGEQCDDGNNTTESCGGQQSCTVCQVGCVWGPGTVTQCTGTTKLSHAAGVTTTRSSVENAGFESALAVDGNVATRWSSLYTDNEWITVNLGSRKNISQVVIDWEPAYANQFRIQLSDNGTDWATHGEYSKSNANDDTITVNKPAKFVRMQGVKRATAWGYSIFEFAVFGSELTCGPSCTPSCSGKACGSDGCGGQCGSGPNAGCGASLKCNASQQCVASCGDGVLHAGETCDDANTNNNDGCTQQCKYEACGDTYVQTTGTGTGHVATNEICDDGNQVNGDGCNGACQVETSLVQLEAESGTNNGCLIEGGGDSGMKAIIDASGDSICWNSVNMAGRTKVTMHYANGEPVGDSFLVKYNTVQIGSLALTNTAGWSSPNMVNGVVTFAAQSGSGTLCIQGSGGGWIGSLDYIRVE